jgi:hypothetical protein
MIAVREASGPFASIEDFAKRLPSKLLNKKVLEALAKSGALDSLGERRQLLENYDKIADFSKDAGDTSGAQADTTRLFDRQFWAGLASPVGEFRVGRQNTAVFYRGGYIDNTTRTLGSVINAFGVPSRYDSDFAYLSPRLYGFQFEGRTFDCGSKLGFLAANVAYALERDDLAPAFRAELKRLLT